MKKILFSLFLFFQLFVINALEVHFVLVDDGFEISVGDGQTLLIKNDKEAMTDENLIYTGLVVSCSMPSSFQELNREQKLHVVKGFLRGAFSWRDRFVLSKKQDDIDISLHEDMSYTIRKGDESYELKRYGETLTFFGPACDFCMQWFVINNLDYALCNGYERLLADTGFWKVYFTLLEAYFT